MVEDVILRYSRGDIPDRTPPSRDQSRDRTRDQSRDRIRDQSRDRTREPSRERAREPSRERMRDRFFNMYFITYINMQSGRRGVAMDGC